MPYEKGMLGRILDGALALAGGRPPSVIRTSSSMSPASYERSPMSDSSEIRRFGVSVSRESARRSPPRRVAKSRSRSRSPGRVAKSRSRSRSRTPPERRTPTPKTALGMTKYSPPRKLPPRSPPKVDLSEIIDSVRRVAERKHRKQRVVSAILPGGYLTRGHPSDVAAEVFTSWNRSDKAVSIWNHLLRLKYDPARSRDDNLDIVTLQAAAEPLSEIK